MKTVQDVVCWLDSFAPFAQAEEYDNVGLLIGDSNALVERIVLALDVTDTVRRRALGIGASLILSHHPVLFEPVKQLLADSLVYRLVRDGLSVIAAHTNLDNAPEGMNLWLAEALGLCEITAPEEEKTPGKCGLLPCALEPEAFAQQVKTKLGMDGIRYVRGRRPVRRVFVCGGAGAFLLPYALRANVDAVVTSEVKHHQAVWAAGEGLTVVDAGHYETERVCLPRLKALLESDMGLTCEICDIDREVFSWG